MSEFNKSYRIRTGVGAQQDTQLRVKLDQHYDILEIMSLKINQNNAYRLHTSNYGVIVGRVLANEAFGIPNAKISVFISRDSSDSEDVIKNVLYPYNTTSSVDKNNIRYNLLPNEQVSDCHTIIGTFPEKQYALDNDSVLEIFEKYYKFTTRTNNAGDYMIFGVPVGSQNVHVDIDLSDIGILSQKPRDMVYKGYNITQFENPSKFRYDTNLNSLTQVISQDNVTEVIPFWGDTSEATIGITRCDINVQYKFEPTCVFMGSVVSDTASNGISKKCIPTPGMGAMDEITTGSGTIEMIRKKPDGSVEEYQIQGTQLINGDGIWCYQIPMNLDFMMTDEFGNMVPTNDPNKGIPTRTRVRFRISMQDFDSDSVNMFRCKVLVPHNPDVYASSSECAKQEDFNFGTLTQDSSYRDLFWNGVYSVKSFIPRIQKGFNWKNEKFTGFKRVNYYGDKNPIPYNNIRIRIPFMYTIMCIIIKTIMRITGFINWIFKLCAALFVKEKDEDGNKTSGAFLSLTGELCNENLDNLCIIPGIDIRRIAERDKNNPTTLLGMAIIKHYQEMGGTGISLDFINEDTMSPRDEKSIDETNRDRTKPTGEQGEVSTSSNAKSEDDKNYDIVIKGVRVSDKLDYLFQCIEMHLAQEYKVIQFDFYNDWINGLVYIPRWMRIVRKKYTFFGSDKLTFGGGVKACNETFSKKNRNIVQQCGLRYNIQNNTVQNNIGCTDKKGSDTNGKLRCHKNKSVRKGLEIFKSGGIVKSLQTLRTTYDSDGNANAPEKNPYVYYFKPYVDTGVNVRLFATDIILLGTLNNCDRWGIPNSLEELVSSTYQLPPNLALTDSDLEGNDYETQWDTTKKITMTIKEKRAKITAIDLGSCYTGINPFEETGNYTEVAGIDWGYTGPLQSGKTSSKLYNPGGHFLGITCRNSETNIKTCVNLSRICEYGVWMSQRQDLNISKNNVSSTSKAPFLSYATVPSGFISKDEISDSSYRYYFASMNKNRLKTVTDNETGYPIYDFEYVKPTNFGGELNEYIKSDNSNYNRKIKDSVTEKEYDWSDDDFTKRSVNSTVTVSETQIMRTGEYADNEYLKFRFGLKDNEITSNSARQKRFLLKEESNKIGMMPIYDNSFYFYFGLRDGKTALDEFKKQYYSVCKASGSLKQIDNSVTITSLSVVYDGICDSSPKGEISFYIKANDSLYGESGVTVTLYDGNNNVVITKKHNNNATKLKFTSLSAGTYTIFVETTDISVNKELSVEVKRVNIRGEVTGVNFMKDVNMLTSNEKFELDRLQNGGYITISGNVFTYEKGASVTEAAEDDGEIIDTSETITPNIFTSGYIKRVVVECKNKGVIYDNNSNSPTQFIFNDVTHECAMNNKGEYMIPVPFENETYSIYLEPCIGVSSCKPEPSYNSLYPNPPLYHIGDVDVNNAIPLGIMYNNLSYNTYLKQYSQYVTDINTYNGWWNPVGVTNWLYEPEDVQWMIKDALYQNDLTKPHKVLISNSGGEPPYEEYVGGMEEVDLVTTTGLTRSDFENVNIPTINYIRSDSNRRINFSYKIKDVNGQFFPASPFIFPVIYKPFFMEMGMCYFDNVDKFYLYGNVYNGKTWDYVNEGFNDVKLNNLNITNLTTITKNDTTMELNEVDTNGNAITGGGYEYKGPHFKYNGRKTPVSREIERVTYGLSHNTNINNFKLSIGTSHNHENVTYSDYTTITRNGLKFFRFDLITAQSNGKYYVKMEPKATNASDYTLIPLFDNEQTGYPYPWNNSAPNFSSKFFKHLMDNSISASSITSISTSINGIGGYIDVSQTTQSDKLYYVALPKDNDSIGESSNTENKLKGISVSGLINLSSLSRFYPLNVNITATDILQSNGLYKTTMTIVPMSNTSSDPSNKSAENFKNKKFVITFYKGSVEGANATVTPLHTLTLFTSTNSTSATSDLTPYRNILGLAGEETVINYYFDVYADNEKAPTSYLLNSDGKPYTMGVSFTDNTPQPSEPTDPQ